MTWPTVSTGGGSSRTRSRPPCTASPGTTTWSRTRARRAQQAWRAEAERFVREADDDRGRAAHAGRCGHARLHQGGGRPGDGGHRHGAGRPHGHRHAVRRAGHVPGGGGPDGPGRPGRGRGLPDPAAARRRLARPGQRAAADRRRPRAGYPVAPLVEQAITWAEDVLAAPGPGAAARARSRPPGGTGRRSGKQNAGRSPRRWCRPALARWVGHRPGAAAAGPAVRPGRAGPPARRRGGLRPGGPDLHHPAADRRRNCTRPAWIRSPRWRPGPWSSGAGLGLSGLDEVLRRGAGLGREDLRRPRRSRQATVAVRRAEARAGEVFPAPLPPPCEVTPMPEVVAVERRRAALHAAAAGRRAARDVLVQHRAAHRRARAGTSRSVAFHEAVPGHHLQLSRLQLLTDLPALQRQRSITGVLRGLGPVRRAAGRGDRAVQPTSAACSGRSARR